jgi:hypothetical protein
MLPRRSAATGARFAASRAAMPAAQRTAIWQRITDWALDRKLVGSDAVANFYERVENTRAGPAVRRSLVMRPGVDDDDVTRVSPEWVSWLRGTRAAAPTAEESAALAHGRVAVQQKAAELAAEERRRKDRARVLSQTTAPADALGQTPPAAGAAQEWTPP